MLGKELLLQALLALVLFMALVLAAGEGSLAPLSLHSIGGVGVCDGVPLQWGVVEDEACECIAWPESVALLGEAGAMGGFSSDWKPAESSGVATVFGAGCGESAATAAGLLDPQPIAKSPRRQPLGRRLAGPPRKKANSLHACGFARSPRLRAHCTRTFFSDSPKKTNSCRTTTRGHH